MSHAWLSGAMVVLSTMAPAAQSADPSVASVKGTFDLVRGHITKAAAQVSEDLYAFKPTPRSGRWERCSPMWPTPTS